jgi:hypothetical protein
MNAIAEGVRQLRETSVNQVPNVEHVLVTRRHRGADIGSDCQLALPNRVGGVSLTAGGRLTTAEPTMLTIVGHQQVTDAHLATLAGDFGVGLIRFKAGVAQRDAMLGGISGLNRRSYTNLVATRIWLCACRSQHKVAITTRAFRSGGRCAQEPVANLGTFKPLRPTHSSVL